jgi:hypothetical protein
LHFGGDAGAFAPLIAVAPCTHGLRGFAVPASFLDIVSPAVAPVSFQVDRDLDFARSLTEPARLSTHLQVQGWTLDGSGSRATG